MTQLTYVQSLLAACTGVLFVGSVGVSWLSLTMAVAAPDAGWAARLVGLVGYLFYAGMATVCRATLGHLYITGSESL